MILNTDCFVPDALLEEFGRECLHLTGDDFSEVFGVCKFEPLQDSRRDGFSFAEIPITESTVDPAIYGANFVSDQARHK